MVRDYLNESKIRCAYHDRGCEEIVQLQHLDQHEDSCGFTPAVCTNQGCGATLNMRDLTIHESELCEYRKLKCHSCGEMTKTLADMEKRMTRMETNQANVQKNMEDKPEEESQLLTTFNTEFGRYCYKRMPFGIKSAQEVFQKRMSQSFGDLEGVETDVDDILVWGTTAEEHDHRLKKTLQRCQEINLTLNENKCEFGTTEVVYIGHKLTAQGVKPDQSKVDAINKIPQPTCKKDAERLLGMVNYFAKFVPQMSMITDPIRKVMKSDVEFKWGKQQQEAFRQIKEILTAAPVLAYYDVKRPVTITCDASKSGLGAVLLQEGKPVAYASRALTDAETRYA